MTKGGEKIMMAACAMAGGSGHGGTSLTVEVLMAVWDFLDCELEGEVGMGERGWRISYWKGLEGRNPVFGDLQNVSGGLFLGWAKKK